MIDLEQMVETLWGSSNKNRYISHGYKFTRMGDKLLVKVKDLSSGSHVKVNVVCDFCGETKVIKYHGYTKNISNGMYKCHKCINKDITQSQKMSWDIIKKIFTDKDYTLLSESSEYENRQSLLSFVCNKHKELGVQITSISNMLQGRDNCRACISEARQGSNNGSWKGGLSNFNDYIRDKIIVWKSDSMKSCNYKCVLTGDKFDNIHHLYGFNLILRDVVNETGFELKDTIGDYTDDDLEILVNRIISKHQEHPLGVCLRKDVHMLFHSLYGKGDNTPGQFYEFRDRYNNGEFNEILSCN